MHHKKYLKFPNLYNTISTYKGLNYNLRSFNLKIILFETGNINLTFIVLKLLALIYISIMRKIMRKIHVYFIKL